MRATVLYLPRIISPCILLYSIALETSEAGTGVEKLAEEAATGPVWRRRNVTLSVGVVLPWLGSPALLTIWPPRKVVVSAAWVGTHPVSRSGLNVAGGK